MLAINTNSLSLYAQRRLDASQGTLARTIQRLSSGLRVNGAADDAAGLAISERINTDIRANSQVQRGINDGISLVQVADGALETVQGMLQRLRELALQSANGTLTDQDRAALNTESQELRAEIDRVANSTQIFGIYPLRDESVTPPPILGNTPDVTAVFPTSGSGGSFSSGIVSLAYIPSGSQNFTIDINSLSADDDVQLFTRDGRHLAGTPITGANPDWVWTNNSGNVAITDAPSAAASLLTTDNGFLPGATLQEGGLLQGPASYTYPAGSSTTYNGMTITYTGDGDRYEAGAGGNNGSIPTTTMRQEAINIDQTTEDLLLFVVGSGLFTATATWDFMPTESMPPPTTDPGTRIVMDASFGATPQIKDIRKTPSDLATLGLSTMNLSTQGAALSAVSSLDQAIDAVTTYRAEYGAHASLFERAIANLAVSYENHAAARGRIIDADFAAETAALTRTQILQQSGTAMLAQANQLPQQVLALLRG